jgi:hypothetical protein
MQLASIGQFLNSAKSLQKDPGYTNILKMTSNVVVRNGMAQPTICRRCSTWRTLASPAVRTWSILDVTGVLSKGFSQQIGGIGIGGCINIALANNQGETVIRQRSPAPFSTLCSDPLFRDRPNEIKELDAQYGQSAGWSPRYSGKLAGTKECESQSRPNSEYGTAAEPRRRDPDIFGKKKKNTDQPPPKMQINEFRSDRIPRVGVDRLGHLRSSQVLHNRLEIFRRQPS